MFTHSLTRSTGNFFPVSVFAFLVMLLLSNNETIANNYYFSSSIGDDTRTSIQARNPSTPWKTITKLNSYFSSLIAGDSVLFKKGDVFEGTITPSISGTQTNPIIISSYGSGDKPIISGFQTITGWTSHGSGIYSKAVTAQSVPNMVIINGVNTPLGRYPNSGYLTYESFSGYASITDNELTGSPNWTGAEVVIKKREWIIDRCLISNHTNNTFTYTNSSTNPGKAGWGYFIQNDTNTFDIIGEWCYRNGRLYMFFGTANPDSYKVKVSVIDRNIYINNKNFITINDLTLEGANEYGAYFYSGSKLKILNCEIKNIGKTAVYNPGNSYLTLSGCNISNINDHVVFGSSSSINAYVAHNIIRNIGIIPGNAGVGDGHNFGVSLQANNCIAEYNTITNSGYFGIILGGNNTIVRYNSIDSACLLKNDGSAIYVSGAQTTVMSNRIVEYNVIRNVIGTTFGNAGATPSARGIYVDGSGNNVTIQNNTILNCVEGGIYLSFFTHDIKVLNNTLYNNKYNMYFIEGDTVENNYTINGNILISSGQATDLMRTINTGTYNSALIPYSYRPAEKMGTWDGNFYIKPFDDKSIFRHQYITPKLIYDCFTIKGWSQFDVNMKFPPFEIAPYKINSLIGNNKVSNGLFTTNTSGTSITYYGTSHLNWDNTNKINGGSAKISYSAPLATQWSYLFIKIPVGSVAAGKKYILKFDILGTKPDRAIAVRLARPSSNEALTPDNKYYPFTNAGTTTNEILFEPTASELNANIYLTLRDEDSTVYIDNVSLYEADATMPNPMDILRFEYNATASDKIISLTESYKKINGTDIAGNLTLSPYTSVLLFKNSETSQNHAPVISNQTFSVAENSANGSTVGTIVASDPDAGQTKTYSITSGNTNGAFAINASTGVLSVANTAALNIEVTPAVALVIKVQDNGTGTLSSQATITISLTDVNESPVILNQAFSVAENSANGTTVGTIVASDPDAGQTFSFQIVSGNTNNAFTINASTGKLSISNSTEINFTINPVFLLGVQVSDNGSGSLSNNAIISLTILPGNNQVPVINDQIFTISQNSIAGTLVGIVQATDANMEQILAFAILSGNPDEAFSINSSTREIFVSNNNFIHSKSTLSYSLVVQVKDNGQISLSNQAIVTVILLPVNYPPVIQNQILNTLEHNPSGSFVGNIIATDPDSENPVLFSITSGNYGDGFDINPNNGLLAIKNPTAVCYEGQPIFNLFVKAQDGEGLTSEALITINVADINEKPICNNQVFSISENVPAQTIVGSVVAHDNDFNQTLTYSIVSGNLNNAFTINPSNGMLEVSNAAALNFEETGVFELIISVADNGPGYLTTFLTVTIELLDVNEPPVLENQVLSVVEKASPGAKIGFLKAKDPDKGQTVKYMIASGNESHAFNLNDSSGLISVDDPTKLSYGRNALFALTVIAQDNGVDSLSTLSVITIYILPDSSEIIQTGLEINSMAKVFDEKDISVYPNPTADIVNINLEKIEDKPVDIQIFNMAGYSIYSSVTKGEKNIAVSMKDQKPGSYIVLINIDGQMCSRNIIVQNRN